MGRKPKQTFLQRRHTDGQQAHEKMFIITSYQRNANQNYSDILLHTVRMAIIKKTTNNKCWGGYGEKGNFLHCWWECKLVQPLWITVWKFLKKLKIELPYDPAIPLSHSWVYIRIKLIRKDKCTPMFIATLFTIAKTLKQPKCPSTDDWLRKMWYNTQWNTTQP